MFFYLFSNYGNFYASLQFTYCNSPYANPMPWKLEKRVKEQFKSKEDDFLKRIYMYQKRQQIIPVRVVNVVTDE